MNKLNNIESIVENALCSACGACSGICLSGAVLMTENSAGYLTAKVDNAKCTGCGMCFKICSGNAENTPQADNIDLFHGDCLQGYIGHATDDKIRRNSQSGGIVTALLCYLLDKKLVDGAVVNKFNTQTRRPKAVLATSKEEVIDGAGSYYSQSAVIETVLQHKEMKTASVVLGCQAQSIRNIRLRYPQIRTPQYLIGLICAGQNSGKIIDDLIWQSHCDKDEQVTRFRFRDKRFGGWPGNVAVFAGENTYLLDKQKRLGLKPVYECYRCIHCYDQMNVFSDIVVGDPWGFSAKQTKQGESVVIARTPKGQKLLEAAQKDGVIELEDVPVDAINKGQTVDVRHIPDCLLALEIFNKNNWPVSIDKIHFLNMGGDCADRKKYNRMYKRLVYTRRLFIETYPDNVSKMINRQKRMLFINRLLKLPVRMVKRAIKLGLRTVKKAIERIKMK